MKTLFRVLLLVFLPVVVFSQNKLELGVQMNGGWSFFSPANDDYKLYTYDTESSFSPGIGIYAVYHLWKPFSLVSGLGYQYKQNRQLEHLPGEVVVGDDGEKHIYGSGAEYWDKWKLHYLRVPLKLRMGSRKGLFVESGVEMDWLLHYDGAIREKPEWFWSVGLGSCKHRLTWSIDYVKGFGSQLLGNEYVPNGCPNFFENKTTQLSFSYPLWNH